MLTIRPTRIGPLRRLRMTLRATYIRMLMRACEQDIRWHQETQALAPQLETMARQRLDELRVELIDCELCTRTN